MNNSICVKEKEVDQLNASLKQATDDARKMQAKIDSTNLIIEAKVLDIETSSEQMRDMQDQIVAARDLIEEKNEEISNLTSSVKCLEDEVQDTKDSSEKKTAEERGPRLDETRRLQTSLVAKEK